jgi:uncharacterized protein (DUF697 family)
MSDTIATSGSKVRRLARKVLDQAIDGVPPLSKASDLAQEYLIDQSYKSSDERADALIRWEATKNFTSGFLTGLGGIVTLPVALPSALGASWVIQARLCAAIAAIYGHNLRKDRVRTLVFLTLLGDSAKEVLKEGGVVVGKRLTVGAIGRVPGKVLIDINKRVGFRLLTKAGEKGVVNLTKMVPVFGGVVGGAFDAAMCIAVGKFAKKLFRTP